MNTASLNGLFFNVVIIVILKAIIKMGYRLLRIIVVYCFFRFLLGKHKAAIEFYHEAARLNENDWVVESKHSLIPTLSLRLFFFLAEIIAPTNSANI